MSKSGLFAHFGSREDLQLAVLDHAAQLYGEKVFVPVLKIERGLPRLRALFERWLDWALESGLPGGCIMISAAIEYDDRPGPIRDAAIANQHRGNAITKKAVRLAIEEGHLAPAPIRSRSASRCSASCSPATTIVACWAIRKRVSERLRLLRSSFPATLPRAPPPRNLERNPHAHRLFAVQNKHERSILGVRTASFPTSRLRWPSACS